MKQRDFGRKHRRPSLEQRSWLVEVSHTNHQQGVCTATKHTKSSFQAHLLTKSSPTSGRRSLMLSPLCTAWCPSRVGRANQVTFLSHGTHHQDQRPREATLRLWTGGDPQGCAAWFLGPKGWPQLPVESVAVWPQPSFQGLLLQDLQGSLGWGQEGGKDLAAYPFCMSPRGLTSAVVTCLAHCHVAQRQPSLDPIRAVSLSDICVCAIYDQQSIVCYAIPSTVFSNS